MDCQEHGGSARSIRPLADAPRRPEKQRRTDLTATSSRQPDSLPPDNMVYSIRINQRLRSPTARLPGNGSQRGIGTSGQAGSGAVDANQIAGSALNNVLSGVVVISAPNTQLLASRPLQWQPTSKV